FAHHLVFLGGIGIVFYLLHPLFAVGLGHVARFAQAVAQQSLFVGMFLLQLVHRLVSRFLFLFALLNFLLLFGKVAVADQRLGNQLALILSFLTLSRTGSHRLQGSLPAVLYNHILVILHRLGPVVHQVLVDVVFVNERGIRPGLEQIFRKRFNKRGGTGFFGNSFQLPVMIILPALKYRI